CDAAPGFATMETLPLIRSHTGFGNASATASERWWLVVSGDAFGEVESFSGDAGGVVLSFQGDAVCAFLGLGALPGRHHQPTVGLRGTRRFGQNQLAGGCGQCGEEQGATGFGGVHLSRGAVQMTVPSG